jgi:hypothetical protein
MTHCAQEYTRETSLTQFGRIVSFKIDIAWFSSIDYRLRLSTVYFKSESNVRCFACCISGNFFVDIFLVSKSRCLTYCFRRHILTRSSVPTALKITRGLGQMSSFVRKQQNDRQVPLLRPMLLSINCVVFSARYLQT